MSRDWATRTPTFRESERRTMWDLLKRLGTSCLGGHDWIFRANSRGLWLECCHCGYESPGLELPTPRFRRTQSGNEAAHRIPRAAPVVPAEPLRFGGHLTTLRASVPAQWPVTAASAPAMTDAERRWLQAWRAMTSDEQAIAERMVAGLTGPRVAIQHGTADQRPMVSGHARVRAFADESLPEEAPTAAGREQPCHVA